MGGAASAVANPLHAAVPQSSMSVLSDYGRTCRQGHHGCDPVAHSAARNPLGRLRCSPEASLVRCRYVAGSSGSAAAHRPALRLACLDLEFRQPGRRASRLEAMPLPQFGGHDCATPVTVVNSGNRTGLVGRGPSIGGSRLRSVWNASVACNTRAWRKRTGSPKNGRMRLERPQRPPPRGTGVR